MVPAAVARRFVQPLHSSHMERQRCEKRKENRIKVGIMEAKYTYGKTHIRLADTEKQI